MRDPLPPPPSETPQPDLPGLAFSPAAARNRDPILAQLRAHLPVDAAVLELASGTGQHAAHVAVACPGWTWQPTDADVGALQTIAARCTGLPNVAPARRLDVCRDPWPDSDRPAGAWTAVFAANLVHISPWAVTPALMKGVARVLAPGGWLLLYGPFVVDDEPLAPSNVAFDANLRARDPAWGLRRLADLQVEADAAGLQWQGRQSMPANNLFLAWRQPA